LDNIDQKQFVDHYANCKTNKTDPSMVQISFTIGFISLVLTYIIGIPLGIQMANHKGKLFDKMGQWYIIFMISIPGLAYIVLVRFLGSKYADLPGMFPMLGSSNPKSYILPIISLTLMSVAGRMMWMRRYMIDQTTMDYVKFARAKGLSENEIFFKHIFRNAIGPIAHGLPAAVIFCISGALITEAVYSIPGMGKILPDSINVYNNSMVIGITFLFTTLAIFSTFLGDWLLTLVDPRITLHEKGGRK
ncbi:ABC transporter permease subunit, partial [Turicibacter sanguinis]|nr:ABC transporter permease subunit [Turicibacter sanguinis]MTN18084.1 ABC transporter permease subunit [Turicibacter sanguinis]